MSVKAIKRCSATGSEANSPKRSRQKPRKHRAPELLTPGDPVNVSTRRCPVSKAEADRRILILQTGANGDILMSTPLLTALRDAYPAAHITWLAEHSAMGSIDTNPFVDTVICWDGNYFRQPFKRGNFLFFALRCVAFARLLQRGQYSLFISFEPEQWMALTLFLRRKATTIGIFDRWCALEKNEKTHHNRRFFQHVFTRSELPVHRTDQALLPLRSLGIARAGASTPSMSLGYRAEDRVTTKQYLRCHGVSETERYIVVAPLTTWESRCWSSERYAQLCDRLRRETGIPVVVIGSEQERPAVEALLAQTRERHVAAAGVFSFRMMTALIGGAALLISGDTGPMHVAGAVGTPYLALFGATPIAGRAPLAGRGLSLSHPIPCGPCDQVLCNNPPETYMRCMELITINEVMHAATSLLND